MSTLTQKLYALVSDNDRGWDHVHECMQEKVPAEADGEGNPGYDLLGWGLLYGIAVGIARTEDPFEPLESVARRAQQAAWTVRKVCAHGFLCAVEMPTDEDERAVRWNVPEAATA